MDTQIGEVDSSVQMKILSNPIRQRILKLIAEQGSISFTAIKEELELTDGSLFYHLKNLDSYIQKDQQSFYQLNEKGKKIVEDIIHKASLPDTDEEKKSWFIDKIAFRELYYYFFGDSVRSLIELNIFLLVVAWLFGVSSTYFSSIESILEGGAIINGLISITHWYLYLALVFLILKTIKNELNIKELWIGIFVGIIPYIIYLIPIGIIHYTNTIMEGWLLILMNIIFAIVKIISAIFVSQGIYLSTNCKQYQAVLIASVLIIFDYIYLMITL